MSTIETHTIPRPAPLPTTGKPVWASNPPSVSHAATHPAAPKPYQIPAAPSNIPASAKAIVQQFLGQFGLEQLTDWAWGQYVKLGGGANALTAIQVELPNQAAFKARFPAYAALAAKGDAWTPAQIIQYEQSARDALNTIGLGSAYGNDEIQQLLIGGVSINELGQRVTLAQQAASAPHQVTDQLRSIYGLSNQQLAAYWFDPKRSLTQIQNQWQAAQVAGESQIAGYGQLSKSEAEDLAANGLAGSAGQNALTQLAQERGLYTQQAGEQTALTRAQQLGTLTGNADALNAFQRRAAQRVAQYQGGGGFGVGQNGVTGLGNNA